MKEITAKHPRSLRIFFGTEMWERYGFYVVQTLLALYLSQVFHWQDDRTYALVGSFTALTYLSPVIGGWIADRFLGQKASILLGIFFLFLSYWMLAGLYNNLALAASLAGIAVGTGLLKPNISSLLGNEYPPGSTHRENGFTIFYMGIATGIILGTTIPSLVNNYLGWTAAFSSATIAMIFSFIVFSFGIKVYNIHDYNPPTHNFKNSISALAIILGLWLLCFYVFYYPKLANIAFVAVVLLSSFYLIYTIKNERCPVQAKQTAIIALLCIISVIFWAFYFQMFLSLTLFIARVVKSDLFGLSFPPPYYVTIQSIGLIVFGYFLSKKKQSLELVERGKSTAIKFMLAILFMIMAYSLITLISHLAVDNFMISPLLILPAYLMISVAELLLSPVGLSAITVLAPRDKVSTMMGIFFVSLGLGGFLSGKLASITSVHDQQISLHALKLHYAQTFSELMTILLVLSVICFGLYLLINKILEQTEAAQV